jgi:hypothetical protein
MIKRRPATDAGIERSQRARAQRVTPYAAEFAARIRYRDSLGHEFSEPEEDDSALVQSRRRFPGSTLLYMRNRKGRSRSAGRLRRGDVVRLFDMQSRNEISAMVSDVNQAPSLRSPYGYVILTRFEIVSTQILNPADFL